MRFKPGRFGSGSERGVRWWPLFLIILGLAGFLLWTWIVRDIQRQDKNLATAVAGLAGILLVLLWCLFFSRARWGLRWVAVGGFVVFGAISASLFTIRDVTGDLVPVLEWRWKEALAEMQPTAVVNSTNVAASGPEFVPGDFPQFLGPARDVQIRGPELSRDWSTRPPQLLWRRPVGAAWAGFAVLGTRAVTMEQAGEQEVVGCYDLLTGNSLWSHTYPARYDTPIGGLGPRTVPTIAGQKVYALGATGFLSCLDFESGRQLWQVNILTENGAVLPDWGVAGSPLLHAGKVIVSAGGPAGRSLVAYDAETGRRLWGGGDAAASYSSPSLITLAGGEQVLMFNEPRITSHDPQTGAVLWEYPWGKGHPHVAVPVPVSGDTVLFSSGYGIGAELLKVKRDDTGAWSVEQVWKSIRMKAKFANLARRGDFVYGLDDGHLACISLADGGLRWKEGRYGHGQLLLVNDLLIVTAENGEVLLLEANPDAARELGRFRAFDHKQWNPPALAGQLLLLRTDREAACYLLPLAAAPPATAEAALGESTP